MTSVLIVAAVPVVCILLFTWRAVRIRRRLLAQVEAVVLRDIHSVHLDNRRDITVYLPPAYSTSANRQYDVLYVNDGQEADALGLREKLAALTRAGRMYPIIAVAVPTNADRLQEYGTAVSPNSRGLGARAPEYAAFIVEELMPLIDTRFRTSGSAAFLGVSLGGLSAFDIVWNHPRRFDTVGVFSGSFWWHTAPDVTPDVRDFRIAHELVRTSNYHPGFRGFFQTGTRDEVMDRDGDGVIDAIQDTQELIAELVELGYRLGDDLCYVEIKGGRHDWETWAGVLPQFLIWAFNPAHARPAK